MIQEALYKPMQLVGPRDKKATILTALKIKAVRTPVIEEYGRVLSAIGNVAGQQGLAISDFVPLRPITRRIPAGGEIRPEEVSMVDNNPRLLYHGGTISPERPAIAAMDLSGVEERVMSHYTDRAIITYRHPETGEIVREVVSQDRVAGEEQPNEEQRRALRRSAYQRFREEFRARLGVSADSTLWFGEDEAENNND